MKKKKVISKEQVCISTFIDSSLMHKFSDDVLGKIPVCSQPKVTGPCEAAIRRFWYNKKTNKCEQFIYGGCQGNKNNFETKRACQNRCQRKSCKWQDLVISTF